MSDQKYDGWDDDTPVGSAKTSRSPFDDVRTLENLSVDDDLDRATSAQAQQQTAQGAKPNYAVLGAAGVLGLAVLAGVGLFVKDNLFPSNSQVPDQRVAMAPAPASPVTSPEPSPVPALTSTAEQASVFDQQAPNAAGGAVIDQAAPASVATSAIKPVFAGGPLETSTGVSAAPSAPVATVACDKEKSARAAPKIQTHKRAYAAARPRVTSDGKVSKQTAVITEPEAIPQAKAGQETIVLPDGMKVHAIYPLSGPDTQAWIREPSGRTTIVRVGEFLAGAQVTKIQAEKGEVVTTSGVLSSSGQR